MNRSTEQLLKAVSRSFYLSIKLLPKKMRGSIGLAFLFCKFADTIADTDLISASERLSQLEEFRNHFLSSHRSDFSSSELSVLGGSAAERKLLESLSLLFEELQHIEKKDQELITWLVPELTQGMQVDLRYFSAEKKLTALEHEEDLEKYIYYVAGCVGIFWSQIIQNHYSFAINWSNEVFLAAEHFGKGLQLVNVLRDFPRDLQQGRCYFPQEKLHEYKLKVEDLLDESNLEKVSPLLHYYISKARYYLGFGETYLKHLPRLALRLRASVTLPMELGFKTLYLLEEDKQWLNPKHVVKVSRSEVYRTFLSSLIC